MRAGTSPALARLSHVHTNSGQFSMKTATVSPLVKPSDRKKWVTLLLRSSTCRKVHSWSR